MNKLSRAVDFLLVVICVSAGIFLSSWYTYSRGLEDGVVRYKRSRQFMLTLQSMYRFGVADGCTDDRICDAAGYPAEETGNR